MKPNWLRLTSLLLLSAATLQSHAQQSEADGKLLAELRSSAQKGDPDSQIELGTAFHLGNLGLTKDHVEAVKWYRKAAEQDFPKAQYNLGVCYSIGEGVAKDEAQAMIWHRKAAEQNLAESQFNLACGYRDGRGVPKNQIEAAKWFRRAAERGLAQAQLTLGSSYLDGKGVETDTKEAVKWFRKAAEQDLVSAQFNLGLAYRQGRGLTKDQAEAAKWLRKAAEQGDPEAQFLTGQFYANGEGVQTNEIEAVYWYQKAAELDFPEAQFNLANRFAEGRGVAKDELNAVKWYRKAAEQNLAQAQVNLANCYASGTGLSKDEVEAIKWYRKAAEQNHAMAQYNLGHRYSGGQGVVKDYVEGYKWTLLAVAQGHDLAKKIMNALENVMTREQIAEGQKLAREFKPRKLASNGDDRPSNGVAQTTPQSSGTGFFITEDGYFITNEHVVAGAVQVRLVTASGFILAKVVKVDAANDLALLKAEGRFAALPVAASRGVKLGGTVATVGFPNIGLQGFAPKLAKGEIASLSGAQDDARYFQISVPVQPGNSGGALVDERGNVVGVVSARLSDVAALRVSGSLPQNVNYAVKSSYLLSFLESVPEVAAKLREPETKDRKFEDVVKSAEQAAVLVLVY